MTIEYLQNLASRLGSGPVPTQEKKLYAVCGPSQELSRTIPGNLLIEKSILDAFVGIEIPETDEKIRSWLPQRLSNWLSGLQQNRRTSIIVLYDAVLLCRYKVPLTFFYDLTGDAHAIALHWARNENHRVLQLPSYIRFDTTEVARFFENSLGPCCFIL